MSIEYKTVGAGTSPNLGPAIFERFIERVGGALAAIEEAGLSHGDLHEGNILVVPGRTPSVAQEFWVIDFIGIPSISSPALEISSDIENFRDHLLRATIIACERLPGYSAHLLLGDRVFRVLQGLRNNSYISFKEMLADFNKPQVSVPEDYFTAPEPKPFEWLRVEWIPSSKWLFKLFEPFQSRFDIIHRFGNTWISGPRGGHLWSFMANLHTKTCNGVWNYQCNFIINSFHNGGRVE